MIEARIFRNKAGEWFYAIPESEPVMVSIVVTEKSVTPWEDFNQVCGRYVIVRSWELLGKPNILRFTRPATDKRHGIVAIISDKGLKTKTEQGQKGPYKLDRRLKNSNVDLSDRQLVLGACLYAHINNLRLVEIRNLSRVGGIVEP